MKLYAEDIKHMLLYPNRQVYDTQHHRRGIVDSINLHSELYYTPYERTGPYVVYMQRVDHCLPILNYEERQYYTQLWPSLLNGLHYITDVEATLQHNQAHKKSLTLKP